MKAWVFALALLAAPAPLMAQSPPAGPAPARGMVDQPCPAGTIPPTPRMVGGKLLSTPAEIAAWAAAAAWQKAHDWPWLCRYAADNAAIGHARVVFMGDSITEGWQLGDPSLFTRGLVDRGISGQTSPQMLLRFMGDVVALHPRVVHIMAGTNDVAGNTGPNSPEQFENNITAMIDIARAHHIAVVLASIPPTRRMPWAADLHPAARIVALNAWMRATAAVRHLVYADYTHILAESDGGMAPAFSGDGVHPNAAGYAAMRPVTEAALARALTRRR